MNKSTPLAKGVRTFVFLLAGSAVGWATLDLVADFRTGATLIALNVLAAFIGGLIAFGQAYTSVTGTSPATRALFTLIQGLVGWLGTVAISELTVDAFANFGRGFVRALVGSVLAAVIALLQNATEDHPEVAT